MKTVKHEYKNCVNIRTVVGAFTIFKSVLEVPI